MRMTQHAGLYLKVWRATSTTDLLKTEEQQNGWTMLGMRERQASDLHSDNTKTVRICYILPRMYVA